VPAAAARSCWPCAVACAVLRGGLWIALAFTGLVTALTLLALQALAPQPGDWSVNLRVGPLARAISVPAVLRVATHPLGLAVLDGRSTDTPLGRWHWRRTAPDALIGMCAPCTLQLDALGPVPLVLPRAELRLQRPEVDRFRGQLLLGEGARGAPPLTIAWRAKLQATGLAIDAELPATPIADAYAALGPQAVPELTRARIAGRLSGRFSAQWPGGKVKPVLKVEGFEVEGLGTEALRDVALPEGCGRSALGRLPPGRRTAAPQAERVTGWLPRAVVAAEDQRFLEHPGYDLAQLLAAWSANERAPQSAASRAALQGASTLTQQLAKRVYVGDERSAVRKLRELLYAVEMERTLGKGRILQLYLQLAPWGEGVCGADAAAHAHLGKAIEQLTPLEAAWLASLLRDGARAQAHVRAHQAGEVDRERVAFVLGSLRGPLSAERRAEQLDRLQQWAPPRRR
jgi:hypothetical protein